VFNAVFNTLIPLSRELLWPMIDSVMSSCCSHMAWLHPWS